MDLKRLPSGTVRLDGSSLQVSAHWLVTHYQIPVDAMADAIDEIMSWGVRIELGNGIWVDSYLFQQLLTLPRFARCLSQPQQEEIKGLFSPPKILGRKAA